MAQTSISIPRISSALSIALLFLPAVTTKPASGDDLLDNGDRVVFIGDSNTYAGHYVAVIDAMARANGHQYEIINVGLPSETCCGLSEPDHPFPRPTVQERIDRVLKKLKPKVVVACYGMNDGIYHPFSEARFARYKDGIKELIVKVKKSDAKIILLTPPPFDPLPMKKKGKLVDQKSKKFAWFLIYENYDSVLKKYTDWIKTLDQQVDGVIDIRTPIVSFLNKKRKANPEFTMSGDGVHFNDTCHRIIAKAVAAKILPELKLDPDEKIVSLASRKMQVLRDAWLSESGHKRPGVKKGKPIDEATKIAQLINSQIQGLSKK